MARLLPISRTESNDSASKRAGGAGRKLLLLVLGIGTAAIAWIALRRTRSDGAEGDPTTAHEVQIDELDEDAAEDPDWGDKPADDPGIASQPLTEDEPGFQSEETDVDAEDVDPSDATDSSQPLAGDEPLTREDEAESDDDLTDEDSPARQDETDLEPDEETDSEDDTQHVTGEEPDESDDR